MEEKKNNAVEKAEKAVKNSSGNKKKTSKKAQPKKSVKAKSDKKEQLKAERIKAKQEKALKREKEKAEREKVRAEKRVELARIKAHKKAEREKAQAAAIREKNRKKAELKAHRAQLRAEKEERRQMLKNESKKDRQRRIAEERAEKARIREQRRQDKQELRKQKLSEKRARRERRQKNREQGRSYGGWLAAVISLGVATLVLASVLTFTFMMPTANDTALESAYQKSFYDTVEQVDNIDLNLSKAISTKDTGAMQLYLVDVAINSELAENDLQQLPLQDESKYYTTKLINQIGDYAKYLNKKIAQGEKLTDDDFAGLTRLYNANRTFKDSLQKMMNQMSIDYSFMSMVDGGNGNLIIENFNELQNLSVEYPELIYDGPFSDGLDDREIKGLVGNEITEDQARDIFINVFSDYELEEVKTMGMASGNPECFNVQAKVKDEILYAQISKKGGNLIMFSYAGSCEAENISGEEASDIAIAFMEKTGIKGVEPVWINLANNVYTINFAYSENGVIVYSDLVKVRVCSETSMVIGMEAISYYTNHTERMIDKPVLSKKQAQAKVSDNIEVETARLVIVPIGASIEKLCYEFSGTYDGATYYVYIDAINGRQVEMFKVIESTEGTLLM